jgi:hypothetical protein
MEGSRRSSRRNCGDGFGNQDLGVKRRQEIGLANENQVAEWRCVGDDDTRHDFQKPSRL